MKKCILPIFAAVALALTVTSCSKDEVFESMNTKWYDFKLAGDEWSVDPANNDMICIKRWDLLQGDILTVGNVSAYLYQTNAYGDEYQVPLPYVFPQDHYYTVFDTTINDSVTYVARRPLELRYEIYPGAIRFIFTDCGEFLTHSVPSVLWIRAVCTYPVNYSIPQ